MSKVFIISAHPEPQSLNGSLKNFAVEALGELGHEVQVSDLYAMGWKASADGNDFVARPASERLIYSRASKAAFLGGTQAPDIVAEQEKLLWADAVIFQFPLWWFSMPAILKGWVERVWACGLGYGVGEHNGERWGDRYGEGNLRGRRGMLSVTVGGREPHFGPRGVNGDLEDLLFPINHGVFYYPGMDVLPPFVVYQAARLDPAAWPAVTEAYRERLSTLFTAAPIPYRRQNGGHYDGQQVLKDGLAVGQRGTRVHLVQAGEPAQRPLEPAQGSNLESSPLKAVGA
ncbi:NAD(P)H-dependent oxidoreductase [Bradyrhizobium elkanii]|uniref:NAD(P)H-dependent oxidoreductase n=1 Tax=Bradyrhizobium elkanii TaxID=29448 RepID=UPI0004B2E018|nr:NAD(P)H-dependent oxidoreductase [Bradyrhizobium elkanii]WLA83283.1 NAD(P)H-dependent oxidoreductase [Bradyrhizobium elkanii]